MNQNDELTRASARLSAIVYRGLPWRCHAASMLHCPAWDARKTCSDPRLSAEPRVRPAGPSRFYLSHPLSRHTVIMQVRHVLHRSDPSATSRNSGLHAAQSRETPILHSVGSKSSRRRNSICAACNTVDRQQMLAIIISSFPP